MARKILLADDSVTAQNMGRKILADAGYEVITVNNGSAALKKIAEVKPDLIVLDVYMPGYSGLEVCQRLKEANETARIPVLLTVGKLEPFKPEEAKRVRAEGFIVKPFEATELLSALTKLEDKMVPRSESSKPGRFARTIAVVEEGRYDKTMTAEEDSGWKNRIAFPSKKKDKAAEAEESDDSAIYNPVNKDLRTVVEHKPTPVPHEAAAHDTKAKAAKDQSRVDVTALAPEGLPKDVTPEEIAALAAAAAQMQGKIAEAKHNDSKVDDSKLNDKTFDETKLDDKKTSDTRASESVAEPLSATGMIASRGTAEIADKVEARADVVAEAAVESKDQLQATAAHSATASSEPPAATFAAQKTEEPKSEELKPEESRSEETTFGGSAEKPVEAAAHAADVNSGSTASTAIAPPSSADVTAAIAALETAGLPSASPSSSSHAEAAYDHARQDEREPVTMALAATASAQGAAAPRWTAVAVALAPEESSIALEDEMRKAYAAYAGAESAPAQAVALSDTPVAEAVAPAQISSAAEAVQQAPPPIAEPEVSQSASAAAEQFGVRVKSFETVAASSAEAQPAAITHASPVEASPVEATPVQATPAPTSESTAFAHETPQKVEATNIEARSEDAQHHEAPIAQVATPEPAPEIASPAAEQHKEESTAAKEDFHSQEDHREESAPAVAAPTAVEPAPAVSVYAPETVEAARRDEVASVSSTGTEPAALDEPAQDEPAHRAPGKDSDIATSTAAAWASWRRIRESGDSKHATQSSHKETDEDQPSNSRDEAAMAVAAGAEKAPEEGPEIASIVDSVLADLRPKIVEEISRKLKKK